jgi:hypothetical protein
VRALLIASWSERSSSSGATPCALRVQVRADIRPKAPLREVRRQPGWSTTGPTTTDLVLLPGIHELRTPDMPQKARATFEVRDGPAAVC